MSDYDRQAAEWEAFYTGCVERDECPYSGETILQCKLVDLCDCFDFPEHEEEARELLSEAPSRPLVTDVESPTVRDLLG